MVVECLFLPELVCDGCPAAALGYSSAVLFFLRSLSFPSICSLSLTRDV